MQQTETYQLNLIETSDTFSPAPLNENTQKLESQLRAVGAALDTKAAADDHADLDARVTALEAHKVVAGTYTGNGTTATIHLGFTPIFVIAEPFNNFPRMAIRGHEGGGLSIVEDGFQVSGTYLNYPGTYKFFAIC